ncbi:hypothetical protein AK812_SmicGene27174 [Symbiodinium microadriaticum]|uniref:Uncharacterized protein n=1 Tax=Symbiodinium microadriaticum TaxID=2951 RepID=A0A1Q9D7H0_SYMMI|nr:hypothetical protein AK812_SmicGene27174 [Symbiodinium microadriaticum]
MTGRHRPSSECAANQAIGFLRIFVCLLQERALSHTGLKRLAVGLETALVLDNPKGLCSILAQREHELLAELLEAAVKQCMVVALTRTVGKHYKALPELDDFILYTGHIWRILDMSVPLLDAETFTLYMPVLYKMASEGWIPLSSSLYSQGSAEQDQAGLEADQQSPRHKIEGYNDEDEEAPAVVGPKLDSRGRMQLATQRKVDIGCRRCVLQVLGDGYLLAAVALVVEVTMVMVMVIVAVMAVSSDFRFRNRVKDSSGSQEVFLEKATVVVVAQSIHFDSFVCVDLLPMLVRILRQSPEPFEEGSFVVGPCLPPHMPDVLRISEQGAQLIRAEARTREAVEASAGAIFRSGIALPDAAFAGIEAGIRRCFIHLLSRAAHAEGKCMCPDPSAVANPDLYGDPGACVHAKPALVYALAFLLQRFDDHKLMIELGGGLICEQIKQEMPHRIQALLGGRRETKPKALNARGKSQELATEIHCVISLVLLSGSKGREYEQLVAGALDFANDLQFEGRSKIQREMPGLAGILRSALDLECQQALAPFSTKVAQFASLKPKPLVMENHVTIRVHVEFPDALMKRGLESFRRILTGPLDVLISELAASTSQAMIALASSCYARSLSGFLELCRIAYLHRGILEMPSVMPFLGLARSSYSARQGAQGRRNKEKRLVIPASTKVVSEVFSKSTLQGLLYVSARSTLDPEEAISFRKVLSGPRAQSFQADQSRVQKAAIERMAEEVAHTGITPTQSKELSNIFDLFPAEFGAKVSKDGSIVKNWRDHVTFYCHHASRLQRQRGSAEISSISKCRHMVVEQGYTGAPGFLQDLEAGDWPMKEDKVQQGMIGVCSTVLLPTPAQQAAMRAAIGQSERSEDTSETLFLPEAKILAGAAIARLLCLPDAYRYIQDRRAAKHSVSMFSQHGHPALFDRTFS